MKNERGQAIFEYILVVVALSAIVVVATTALRKAFWESPDGLIHQNLSIEGTPPTSLDRAHFKSGGDW